MAQRYRLKDGTLVEARPDGTYVEVPQGGSGMQLKPADPAKPFEVRQKMIDVQKGQADLQLTPYQLRKQKAEAESAEIKAREDREQYQSQHPSVSTTGLYGDSFLKTLSGSDQSMVKALSEGRLAFPQGAALRSPFWQEKLSQVAQYDPTFDATNFNARAQGRSNAIKGKLGQSNNALNTAIGHLGTLYDQINGTASHGGFPFATTVNSVENWYAKGHGDPGITNFTDTASKLADELESVYRNGGGAEQGVIRQLRNLDPSMSYDQKVGIVRNAVDLLTSKIAANAAQYNFGTGGKPTGDMLDKDAKATIDRIAPGSVDKYFATPQAKNNAVVGPGTVMPPPTGPSSGGPGTGPNNDKPDPQSAAMWEAAARQGMPYTKALSEWQADVRARGLTTVTPPTPGEYQKAATYIAKNPNAEYHPFESVTRAQMSGADQALNSAAQSAPGAFAVHYYNPLLFGVPEMLAGGNQSAYFNAVSRQQHPNASMAGDVLGTVGGMLGAGKAVNAGVDALKANPFLARYFRATGMLEPSGLTGEEARLAGTNAAVRRNVTGDTIYSGVTGANENPDHPVAGAAEGMAATAAGNAAGRYIFGPAVAAAGDTAPGQAIVNAFRRSTSPPFAPPAPLDAGQSLVVNQAKNVLGIQDKLRQASGLNLPYALADADPKLRLLAGSATRKSPDVRTLAENVIAPRQLGQAERAIGQINTNLAPVGDVPTLQSNLLKTAQTQSAPLYDAAKSQPVPELTANPQFKEVLDRPAGQAAIRSGYETALNKGEDVGTLTYATGPDGNQVAYGNPSWNVIHYARQALDKSGDTDVRQALDKQIATMNPGFKTADAAYSGVMKGSDALQSGADATRINVTPEATQRALAGFPNNAPQFQQGYASNMADLIGKQRLSGNPYDLVNGSPFQKEKLGLVFPQGAPRFEQAQSLEGDMARTAQETLGGSPTAARMQSDRMFDSPMTDAAIDLGTMAATGAPPTRLALRAVQKFADLRNLGVLGSKQKADAIGPLLLNPDPAAAQALLDHLTLINLSRQAYRRQAGALGSAIAAPVTYGLTQN